MKTIIFHTTVLLVGLSAGFFFAWSVSVIVGTKKLGDSTYLETMQSINKEILNPLFFTVFFGSLLALILNTYCLQDIKPQFWLVLAATLIYLFGTIGVTGLGNVPLNNQLEALNLTELSPTRLNEFRKHYESDWNRFHLIRTLSALASFILLIITSSYQDN
ncbi:DUF1772 domain-containing protein [Ekhidna sp. To15]|uniref:anthrone oxygenase family protein n=1 Tax=Ekhidna sp. To15 TaxID=3395267 RepID=UPI003F5233A3